ncbi:MAG: helix-turn-helix transcriptional regulator [Clostridia bacterium]|nr:helix-turn-helix transcriptional regulator [Clostridia bacterium]
MNRIKQLREEIGMTQVRLSIELEVAQETISAYEHGKHYPSVASLIKMMKIFNVSIDYILGFSEARTSVSRLTDKEHQLLSSFSRLSDIKKDLAIAYLQGLLDGSE